MQKYTNTSVDTSGNVLASTTVTVYATGTTTPSTIYSDNGATSLANPFTSDADGVFAFYAANGRYDVVLTKTGYTFNADATSDIVLFDPTGFSASGVNNFRLVLSGSDLTLTPISGNSIDIGGVVYSYTTMPTLDTSGTIVEGGAFVADTRYYIYLKDTAGVATLQASTTAYTKDTTGRPMRNGDTTRRLVGSAKTNGAGNWVDSVTQRFVISEANRRMITATTALTANRTVSGGAGTVEVNAEIRAYFLAWADEAIGVSACGSVIPAAPSELITALTIDNATPADSWVHLYMPSAVNNTGFSLTYTAVLAEGAHYASLVGNSATNCVYLGDAAGSDRTTLRVMLRG